MVSVNDLLWRKGWTWTGDPRLVEKWTEIGMMQGGRTPDLSMTEAATKEDLMATTQILGLTGGQVNGLIWILSLGAVEHEQLTKERELSEGK